MDLVKISFGVPMSLYRSIQASAARAGQPLSVFARETVFKACQIDSASLEAEALGSAISLTQTKRDLLECLRNHARSGQQPAYLTTTQIVSAVQQCDQSVYINMRALLRDGLVDRGQNVTRKGGPGAPLKTYAISPLGDTTLDSYLTRVDREFKELQDRQQSSYEASLASINPPRPPDHPSAKKWVHYDLRYIAMAQLGRSIGSDADLDATKAVQARLIAAADTDVASGAHTYTQILAKLKAKIEALGGEAEITARFNGGA